MMTRALCDALGFCILGFDGGGVRSRAGLLSFRVRPADVFGIERMSLLLVGGSDGNRGFARSSLDVALCRRVDVCGGDRSLSSSMWKVDGS